MAWADEKRVLKHPRECGNARGRAQRREKISAQKASVFARTEHMFFEEDRIVADA